MTTKKTTKKTEKKQERREEDRRQENESFISLAKDLKDIVLDHNKRISEVESLVNKIAQRLGL